MNNVTAIKLCEIVIPTPFILNDNANCTYRQNMHKYKWLETQMHMAIGSEVRKDDCLCDVNDKNTVTNALGNKIGLVLTHYKAFSQQFDVSNYERCYKPLIDALTGAGYLKDDNYKIVNPVLFTGGSSAEWCSGSFFGLNRSESAEYPKVGDYIANKVGVKIRMESTKWKKISNYDLFQIFAFNVW